MSSTICASVLRRAAGEVQRVHHCPGARHSIAPGLPNVAVHEDLVRPHRRYIYIETRRRAGSSPNARIHFAESSVERVLELCASETSHVHLANGRNDDESVARHRELRRLLDVARQKQHEAIARTESIVRVRGAADIWIEL